MTDKKNTINKVLKSGTHDEIKKMIMEETKITSNKGLASKGLHLITVVVDCLIHLRDNHKHDLNIDLYNEHLKLESLMKFSDHKIIPLEDVFKVKNYLKDVPGFDVNYNFFKQKEMTKNHHERIKESVLLSL